MPVLLRACYPIVYMRQLLKYIFTTCLCLGTVLMVLEVVSRVALEPSLLRLGNRDWRDTNTYFRGDYVFSQNLGFEPKIGQTQQVLGETTDRSFSILVLGDSVTNRSTFPKLLEGQLNPSDTGRAVRVIPFGIESYNTSQEVEFLRTRILAEVKPDVVIIQFTLNDFDYSPVVVRVDDQVAYFNSPREKLLEKYPFLFNHSSLYRYFRFKNFLTTASIDTQDWPTKKAIMNQTLSDLQAMMAEAGIPYFFLIYPYLQDEQPEPEKSLILSLLTAKQIDYLDLLPVLQKRGSLKQWSTVEAGQIDYIHPNTTIDPVVADAVHEYLSAKINDGVMSGTPVQFEMSL